MPTILEKHTGETMLCDIDCSLIMGVNETITAVQGLSATPTTDPAITFGVPSINASPVTYPDGRTVAAGRVVQVLIGGGQIPGGQRSREYVVTASVSTSNAGELRQAKCRLLVTDEP